MLSKNVLLYGRDEPLLPQIPLRAGPLSLLYENGDLRYIRFHNREVVRRVYVAVRDRNWGTTAPLFSNVEIQDNGDAFRISYDATHRQGDIHFSWHGTIVGDSNGTISFGMDGAARSTFWRNRIGFCILHPIRECAGAATRVLKVDGTIEESRFPKYIQPDAPFEDMVSIAHEVEPGLWANVQFSGDTFETEDQRNWTDASFKTFCTPLRLPYR
jgi:hypothetical protein